MEWTDDDEIAFFRTIIRCRPIGIHQPFRLLNLFLSLNHETQDAPRISMDTIRAKLDALYDMNEIQGAAMEVMTAQLAGDAESDAADEVGGARTASSSVTSTALLKPIGSFELPYVLFRELIEARATAGVVDGADASPVQAAILDDDDDEEALSDPEDEEEEEEEEEDEEEEEEDEEAESEQATPRPKKKQTAAATAAASAARRKARSQAATSSPVSTTKRPGKKRVAPKTERETTEDASEAEGARPARGSRKSARKR